MALLEFNMFSKSLKRMTKFKVHKPNEVNSVLFLLHGAGDNCDAWINYTNIVRYNKDNLIIFPSAELSFYLDRERGEQFCELINELYDYCNQLFGSGTLPLHIAGNSMGGYGAINILVQSELNVRSVALFSPAVDLNDEFLSRFRDGKLKYNKKDYMNSPVDFGVTTIYAYCGENDYQFNGVVEFCKLNQLHLIVDDGEHEWGVWDNQIKIYLKYIEKL